LRKNERGLPQIGHLLYFRTGNLGSLVAFTMSAFVDTYTSPSSAAERKAQLSKESLSFLVFFSGGNDRNVHTPYL